MGAVGSDIEALCSKCGDVWHVVVAEVSGRIAKVQCKECGAYHRYRTAAGVESKAARKRAPSARKTKSPAAPAPRAVEPDLSKAIRSYSIRELFQAGERVDHPTFGIGVVEGATAPGKMTVFFPQGRKVLAQAKPVAKLTRPDRAPAVFTDE